jgi:hypothetical protein
MAPLKKCDDEEQHHYPTQAPAYSPPHFLPPKVKLLVPFQLIPPNCSQPHGDALPQIPRAFVCEMHGASLPHEPEKVGTALVS